MSDVTFVLPTRPLATAWPGLKLALSSQRVVTSVEMLNLDTSKRLQQSATGSHHSVVVY